MISPLLNTGVARNVGEVHQLLQLSAAQLNYGFICKCEMSKTL